MYSMDDMTVRETCSIKVKKMSQVCQVYLSSPGRLLNVLCTFFNLRPVSTGKADLKKALLIKKARTSSLVKFPVFPFLVSMLFFGINTSVEVLT